MFGIGGWELLVIIVVALIVLGPRKLPSAARAVGRAATQLRRATQDLRRSIELDPDMEDLPRSLDQLTKPIIVAGPVYERSPRPKADAPPYEYDQTEPPPPLPRGDLVQDPEPAPFSADDPPGMSKPAPKAESELAPNAESKPAPKAESEPPLAPSAEPEASDSPPPMPRGDLFHGPELEVTKGKKTDEGPQ